MIKFAESLGYKTTYASPGYSNHFHRQVTAMKNSPYRVLGNSRDVAFLLTLPHIDRARIRNYFEQAGLLKIYDELEKDRSRR